MAVHGQVNDTGLEEFAAAHAESVPQVEGRCVALRMQQQVAMAALRGGGNQGPQHRGAHATAACRARDRHASDVSVGQQATCAQGLPAAVDGEGMEGEGVPLVLLDVGGHALFIDEYRQAQRQGARPGLLPVEQLDPPGARDYLTSHSIAPFWLVLPKRSAIILSALTMYSAVETPPRPEICSEPMPRPVDSSRPT